MYFILYIYAVFCFSTLFSCKEVVRKTIYTFFSSPNTSLAATSKEGLWRVAIEFSSCQWTELLRMRGCCGLDPPFQWGEAQKIKEIDVLQPAFHKNNFSFVVLAYGVRVWELYKENYFFCCCFLFFCKCTWMSHLYQCLLMWLALIFALFRLQYYLDFRIFIIIIKLNAVFNLKK